MAYSTEKQANQRPAAKIRTPWPFLFAGLFAILLPFPAHPDPTPAEPGRDKEITGALPLVRLFCSPCYDRYAHQMAARTLSWGVEAKEEEPPAPRPVGPLWERRSSGALRIPPPPPIEPEERRVLLINDSRFEVSHVYVFLDGAWQNVAIHMGLEDGGAMSELPGYIRIEKAPFKEAPSYDDRLFWFY